MEQRPQSGEGRAVIVMPDNQCASPCYDFDTDHRDVRVMPLEILDEVLERVCRLEPSRPSLPPYAIHCRNFWQMRLVPLP